MEWFADWLFGWFYELMYILQRSICFLIDFIKNLFSILIGLDTVTIDGQQTDLLTHFLFSDTVWYAFLGVLLIGVILLFVFVGVAIVRSEMTDGQNKKTKGQIMTKALQSFVIFLIVPVILTAGIMLTNAVMSSISGSMTGQMFSGSGNSTIGGQILVTTGNDAFIGAGNERQQIEYQFISGLLDYNDLDIVKKYYDLSDMNFFVGIAGGLVILIMFVMSVITFIQRIFDIILLYIISPVSVATIPADDGGRFKLWREMLISKVLGAYGIILSMNIYFMIIPQISSVDFFGNSFANGIVNLLFVIGGAFAVTKGNMVIAQLTGSNAGTQEAQQMMSNMQSGAMIARTAGGMASGLAGRFIGGSDYMKNKKQGAGFVDNVKGVAKSGRNKTTVPNEKTKRTAGQMMKGALRLATLPIGAAKDLLQGGAITMGKNFIPRMRNVINGTSFLSHADYKEKKCLEDKKNGTYEEDPAKKAVKATTENSGKKDGVNTVNKPKASKTATTVKLANNKTSELAAPTNSNKTTGNTAPKTPKSRYTISATPKKRSTSNKKSEDKGEKHE